MCHFSSSTSTLRLNILISPNRLTTDLVLDFECAESVFNRYCVSNWIDFGLSMRRIGFQPILCIVPDSSYAGDSQSYTPSALRLQATLHNYATDSGRQHQIEE